MKERKVTMYYEPNSLECLEAKKFLDSQKINYNLYDVKNDPEARNNLKSLTNKQIVPTFQIGNSVIEGFNKEQLTKIIKNNS